ncbi:nuclear-pore anchor isoform X3 [Ananas comosus]|uniref:Nuclear-pore anchor isoform X3 n=1 Tax=Ananas comosus TaxID=4615 RepID=A0A6P5F4W3_ANACO|nr:nuclear-pore anchor isoform X3 [Ananas comosus]
MPLFLSDEEFQLLAHDAAAVAERADAAIRELRRQVETARAEADAASITAEQTCALLEQRFAALSADFDRSQAENAQLAASVERRLSELAEVQAEKHQLHIKIIGKDGEIERLTLEVAELQKSKRQSLELVEQRDAEIRERNATIQSYLDKIVNLTDSAAAKEARLSEIETELTRCHATCNRITQEKELLEKHNSWLEEELNAKVNSLIELRRSSMDAEANMSAKIADLEREISESSNSLKRSKERVVELENRVSSLEKELCASKEAAAVNEQQYGAELSTVTKLAELYKESSDEWSKKAGELEGVIKALETHLAQVENEYKEKLEIEASARKEVEKEAADLKEKLRRCEAELENARKANELSLLPMASFPTDLNMKELLMGEADSDKTDETEQMIVPKVPVGISGTALAACLLRDGWSLAKMYEKYQEAADALRHERWGRKHAEAVLERVLHEIEEKAELILDERAEHERMAEAYSLMNQKLQQALLEHDNFESTIRNLKAELRKQERDYDIAQKEIDDLQKQVAVLLKECQDIQLRCGANLSSDLDTHVSTRSADVTYGIQAEKAVSAHMTFKDINELVEQNVQLRGQVRCLSVEVEKKDAELREGFQIELQKVTDEAKSKIEAVLKRSEEQGCIIESLHSSVAMYKRLYEEEHKLRTSSNTLLESIPDGKKELMPLFEGSQDVSKKAYEQLAERAKNLEQELTKLRSELTTLRTERDKMALEANFARDRLNSFMAELDHQRKEANAVSGRNVELTQLLVDYQKRLRESSDSQQASEDKLRKLSMEVSILKHEKEILVNSEKRALDEVRSLIERVHRLQTSLDTIQTTEEVRENARAVERRNQEEHVKRIEREWAEAKKELHEERDRVRALTLEKEKAIETTVHQVEEMRKELTDAWRAVSSAESRAAVAEARCSDLEGRINGRKSITKDGAHDDSLLSSNEVTEELWKAKEEMEKLREEAQANKNYMLQYKEIAHTNEVALKQIESRHEEYKAEAERLKKTFEDEVLSLRNKLSEMEKNYVLKSEEASSLIEAKEKELLSVLAETSALRDEVAQKVTRIEMLEIQVSSLKDDLDQEHKRWRTAQDNYERQVILQSETIQELTSVSKELSSLQSEMAKLRDISDAQKVENDALKSSWEHEKLELQRDKDEAQRKYNEINEQNKILHNQLESLRIRLADKERSFAGLSSQTADSQTESDLQNVISYLRRSKEIAETELSLLKQEKIRLQSHLENALKASKEAQALLHSQSENFQTTVFKDEEFKSLQLQVREINLLRESNIQLREENKHNFEECQKLRDEAQKAKMEAERLHNLLLEKELEFEACQKEAETQKMETQHLNNRIAELVESYKSIDLKEYEHMKDELQSIKVLLREKETELELTKNLVSEKQELISKLEENLARCQSELAERENKLNDAFQVEASIKMEIEKQKKIISSLKKKNEVLAKEKEELSKDKQGLLKQIEDLKSTGRKTLNETLIDQAAKEKDTRIQILEKTLERERDDLRKERDDNRKEKLKRQKTEKTVLDLIQTVNKDKKKVEEELAKHKQAIVIMLESTGITASQLPSGSTLDEQTFAYFLSVDSFEDAANSLLNDGSGTQPLPPETSAADTSLAAAGRQVPPTTAQTRQSVTPQGKATEEKTGTTVVKPSTEVRKAGRRLVRPRLERPEESQADIEMSAAEGPVVTEDRKPSSSHEPELSGVILSSSHPPPSRKRMASSSVSEPKEESVAQDEAGTETVPPSKKSKDADFDVQSSEIPAIAQEPAGPSADNFDAKSPMEDVDTDEIVEAAGEEEMANKDEVEEHQSAPVDGMNQENEAQSEEDATMEEVRDKSKDAGELIDEGPRSEDPKEIMPLDVEDDREEGELMPDEPEQQIEEAASGEGHSESTPSDGVNAIDETPETVEPASPEPVTEKSENADVLEEVTEGNNNNNNNNSTGPGITETELSSPILLGVREGSPSTLPQASPSRVRESSPSSLLPHSAAPEQQGSSTVSETEEPRGRGRTISITERARQNAPLRQARMAAAQTTPRGRGRPAGGYRANRGARGRGGRGQS